MTDNRTPLNDGHTRSGEEIPVERVDHDHVTHRDHTVTEQVPNYVGDAFRSRVSWGAIFAGTVVGIGVLLMLSLAGLAFGLSATDFGPGQSNGKGFATGAGIWLVVSQLIALAVGGFVAGRLAAVPKTTSTAFHGAAVWGLATLAMAYLASSAISSAVSTAASAIGTVASGAAQVAPAAMPDQQTQNTVASQAEQTFNSILNKREQAQASNAVGQAAENVATGRVTVAEAARNVSNKLFGANGVVGPEDRQQAIDQLARQTGMTQAEAAQTVDNVQNQAKQFAETAPAKINNGLTEATDAAAGAAFWAFIASLLGLVAAMVAAVFGRPGSHDEVVRR